MSLNLIIRWNIFLLGAVVIGAAPASALRENPTDLTASACNAMLQGVIDGAQGGDTCTVEQPESVEVPFTEPQARWLCNYLLQCYEGTPDYRTCLETQKQLEDFCKDEPRTRNSFSKCIPWTPQPLEVRACCDPEHATDLWRSDDKLEGLCKNQAVIDFMKGSL